MRQRNNKIKYNINDNINQYRNMNKGKVYDLAWHLEMLKYGICRLKRQEGWVNVSRMLQEVLMNH